MKGNLFQKLKMRVVFFLARRLPDCRHITPTIGESLDRKLSLRENINVKLHLWTCRACSNYLANLKFMREVFQLQEKRREEEIDPLSVSLSPEARERIKKALISSSK
ncbi:MAG: hypothetical protein R2747_24270 [Pyrinomonadaceae bacterium]